MADINKNENAAAPETIKIDWKEIAVAGAVPIIIFSFAYFNFFAIPYFPSLWQLTHFFATIFSEYFISIAIVILLTTMMLPFIKMKKIKIAAFWLICFAGGFLIVNTVYVEKIVNWGNSILLVLNFLCLSLALCLVIFAFGKDKLPLPLKSVGLIILCFLYWMTSKALIVDHMDFPRYDDFKILIWSSESTDYVYSCANPKGSLYEVKMEKQKDEKTISPIYYVRRTFTNSNINELCTRLFSELRE